MSWPPLPAGLYYSPSVENPYGIVIYVSSTDTLPRYRDNFAFTKHGGLEKTIILAASERERVYIERFGRKPPREKQCQRKHGEHDAGVHYYIDRKMRVDGRIHEIPYWTASWRANGRTHLRKYSIKKYGYEAAYQRARTKRKEMTNGK